MNASERERLRCLVYDLADLAQSKSIGSIGWRVSLDKIGEGLTALLNSPTMPTPATHGFALVGPDGLAIPETMAETKDTAEYLAFEWGGQLPAILATGGYIVRPISIIVEEQTQEPRQ